MIVEWMETVFIFFAKTRWIRNEFFDIKDKF